MICSVLVVLSAGVAVHAEEVSESVPIFLGSPMVDFSTETIDGETFTLSETLKDHKVVMINIFATWCQPCGKEFPAIEKAYEEYKDQVSVIALSRYDGDTLDILRSFAKERGLTFDIGRDEGAQLLEYFGGGGVPKTAIIDRFGNVVYYHSGMEDSSFVYKRLFDYYLRDDYTESEVLTEVPDPVIPAPFSSEELSAAANAPGSSLVFANPEEEENWPMKPVKKDDCDMLVTTNVEVPDSQSSVLTSVQSKEGDAIAFDVITSTDGMADVLRVSVDGELAKCFNGVSDKRSWAIPLTEGTHEISFSYIKDSVFNGPEDCVWLGNVRIVSGQEAEECLAALPVYPAADKFNVELLTEQGRELELILDPDDPKELKPGRLYMVPEDTQTLSVRVSMPAGLDPDMTAVMPGSALVFHPLTEDLTEDGSEYVIKIAFDEKEPDEPARLCLVHGLNGEFYNLYKEIYQDYPNMGVLTAFKTKEQIDEAIQRYKEYGYDVTGWRYLDEEQAANETESENVK